MARKKKDSIESEVPVEESDLASSEANVEENEPISSPKPETKAKSNARLPKIEKGIPDGKITFDIFFAYCIKKYPEQVKVDHYRAMKNYLAQKNCATIDTKQGFCASFKGYGLSIE